MTDRAVMAPSPLGEPFIDLERTTPLRLPNRTIGIPAQAEAELPEFACVARAYQQFEADHVADRDRAAERGFVEISPEFG